MAEMFRNYPQADDYIPNNRPKAIKKMEVSIMTGETTTHTFDIPFDVSDKTKIITLEVLYKVGIDVVLIKTEDELDIEADEPKPGHSLVACQISPLESLLFSNTVLDKFVQIKFFMADGSIQLSEIYEITVRDSLATNLVED